MILWLDAKHLATALELLGSGEDLVEIGPQ